MRAWGVGFLLAIAVAGTTLADQAVPEDAVDCDDPSAIATTVSFSVDVQTVFSFNCVVCHQTGAANGGLVLESGKAYLHLVGVASSESDLPRVVPGDVAGSYLHHKVRGTQQIVGGAGGRMPLGMSQLPDQDLATIETWIRECAQDN